MHIKYFGPEEYRKPDEILVPTPVGETCVYCQDKFVDGDVGSFDMANQPTHYECNMRSVVGSIGHQMKMCSCFGGTTEDPPKLSIRTSAKLATKMYMLDKMTVGDTITRMLAGVVPMKLKITEITPKHIVCGAWKFHRITGAEVDEDLGWDGLSHSGSYIKVLPA